MILIATAWWMAVATTPVAADDARQVFQDQYGQDLIKVRATREAEDDIELAKRMIEQAKAADTSAELAGLLCDTAHTLARRDAAGYDTAVAAMDVLAAKDPSRADAARRKVISLYQSEFGKARGEDKAKAADTLIDILVRYADAAIGQADFTQARLFLGQAQRTARVVKSPREADLDARLDDLSNRERVSKEIAKWQQKLEESPSDAEAHQALLKLHLIDLNDPAGAVPYLELGGDADAKRFVPIATLDADGLEVSQLLALAIWYQSLSDAQGKHQQARMLRRAGRYFDLYLARHREDDAARRDAVKRRYDVEAAMAELCKSGAACDIWVDALRLIDPEKHWIAQEKQFHREGSDIVYRPVDGNHRGLAVPIAPLGGYKLRVRFVRDKGAIHEFVLPLGDRDGAGHFYVREVGHGGIPVSPHDISGEPIIAEGVEHQIDITVRVTETEVAFAVDLNDRPYLSGRVEKSEVKRPSVAPRPYSLAIGAGSAHTVRFKSFLVQPLDGRLIFIE